MASQPRRPWYERFGGIPHDSATQSLSKTGIPVPSGGTFQGRPPQGRRVVSEAAAESLEQRWSAVSRCDRRAEVSEVEWLTRTGTLRLGFEVTDDRPFEFAPGNFLRIERHDPSEGSIGARTASPRPRPSTAASTFLCGSCGWTACPGTWRDAAG